MKCVETAMEEHSIDRPNVVYLGIAEALQPIAKSLPDNSAQRQFAPIARLQTDLSSIFTQIYRETAVYMEAVQANICTLVNAPTPP